MADNQNIQRSEPIPIPMNSNRIPDTPNSLESNIETYFTSGLVPPGERLDKTVKYNNWNNIDMYRGKRPKRTIDSSRSNQNYRKIEQTHEQLHNHYENIDWFERDSSYDLYGYMKKA